LVSPTIFPFNYGWTFQAPQSANCSGLKNSSFTFHNSKIRSNNGGRNLYLSWIPNVSISIETGKHQETPQGMEQEIFWKYLLGPKNPGTKNETNTIGNYNSRALKGIKRIRNVCTRRDFVEEKF